MRCEWCEKEFTPSNSRQKYCCKTCSKYGWNKSKNYNSVKKTKEWRDSNPTKVKASDKQYRDLNKEKLRQNNKIYYNQNKDRHRGNRVRWAKENLEKLREINKTWKSNNKEHIAKQANNKYKNNSTFKLKAILRARLREAIKNHQKTGSAVRDLGCSIEELKIYLESKWQSGMTWENYGRKGWHIDHIRPLSSFNLAHEEQLKIACHYTNLQPLWWQDNLCKGIKYE